MKNKVRFRPYVDDDVMNLFDRVKCATGLSYERILMDFLHESDTFLLLKKIYYDADDTTIKKAFFGLLNNQDICKNDEKL